MRAILTGAQGHWRPRRPRRPRGGVGWPGPAAAPRRLLQRCLALAAAGLLSGCAWWGGETAPEPRVDLIGIRELGRDGDATRYLITLRLSNPGSKPLRVTGLTCSLRVDGIVVAEGFAGALEPLAPHSATRISMAAEANFLAGLKLMNGLSADDPPRDYRLEVRLRRPWLMLPLTLADSGEVVIER